MRRKIIQISSNTNVISLPNTWCRAFSLQKGDEVNLEEKDSMLIISADKPLEEDSISVNVSGTEPMIKRILGALFKTGYDEFRIRFSSPEEKAVIEDVIDREFVGFEIVEAAGDVIMAKKIVDENISEFDNVLKRLFYLIKYIGSESSEILSEQENASLSRLSSLIAKDNEVNKLADYCRRILNKKGYSRFKKTPPLYYIVEQLEKVGDEYRDLLKYITHHKISFGPEEISYLEKVNDFFDMIYDLFYSFSIRKITDLGKTRLLLKEKLLAEIKEKMKGGEEKSSRMHLPVYIFYRDILEKTFDLNGAIMAASF